MIRGYEMLLEERQKVIVAKNQLIEEKNQWIKRLFILCCILVALTIGILIFDLANLIWVSSGVKSPVEPGFFKVPQKRLLPATHL